MRLLHATLVMAAALSITGPCAEAFSVSSAATKVRVGVCRRSGQPESRARDHGDRPPALCASVTVSNGLSRLLAASP